ncbi:MAG: hypothetical protein Kow0092_29550 [Deferrisomatales bacterium]
MTLGAGTVERRAPHAWDKRMDEHGRRKRLAGKILPRPRGQELGERRKEGQG